MFNPISSLTIFLLSLIGLNARADVAFSKTLNLSVNDKPESQITVIKFKVDPFSVAKLSSGNWAAEAEKRLGTGNWTSETTKDLISAGNWTLETISSFSSGNWTAENRRTTYPHQWTPEQLATLLNSGNWATESRSKE